MSYLYDLFIYPIELIVEYIYSRANRIFVNPGLSIVAVSLLVNILVLPLYNKSDAMQEAERKRQESMKRWSEHIKKTFRGDERFMIQSVYYRQQGYKPIYALRGSVSLLLQIPFFIAAYHFLSNLADLQGASFLILSDLGQEDRLIRLGGVSVNLLPILMTGINILSGAIYTRGSGVKEKLQLYGMALIFLVLLYKSPSGLVFYWTLNNLFSLGKNVFLKLIPPTKRARGLCLSLVGIAGAVLLRLKTYEMTTLRLAVLVLFLAVTQLPLILSFFPERQRERAMHFPENKGLMVMSCLFLTVLLGGVISSAVVSSSPAEFMAGVGPFGLIRNDLVIYAGFFAVWMPVFYFLAGEKGRGIMAALAFALGLAAVLNFMFFGRDLGIMSAMFRFDHTPEYGRTETLLSAVLSLLLLAGGIFAAVKKPELARRAALVLTVSAVCLTAVNLFATAREVRSIHETENSGTDGEAAITLSRDGRNVVVLMLDRAVSGYVPYMMAERPELRDSFSGFTYYRNTLSFGGFTNIATPALFGGYEYTPEAINARPEEKLGDKHDQALLLMPTLFSENGYTVSVFDPPYAGFKVPSDLSIFDGLANTKAYSITGFDTLRDYDEFTRLFGQQQKRSLFWYCVFKAVPVPLQSRIYLDGSYGSTNTVGSTNEAFVRNYAAMASLSSITRITDGAENCFVMMDNEMTHDPTYLELPDYKPSVTVTADPYAHSTVFEGIRMENDTQITHYQVDMAAFLRLGEWLDYLKEQGVYDNTRIVLVSDHGWPMGSFDECVMMDGALDMQAYWALLMEKDFDAQESGQSDAFMTIADVPTLAFAGLIDDPVNPFTGSAVDSSRKAGTQRVTTSQNYEPFANNGYVFDLSDGVWYTVRDDIFREENWALVDG